MADIYGRLDWESEFEWKERLIVGKYEGENDLTWDEIKRILNLKIGSHQLRKQAKGIYEAYKHYQRKEPEAYYDETDNFEESKDIEVKRQQLEIERKRLQSVKIEYNRILREEARQIQIVDEIHRALKNTRLPVPKFYRTPNCGDENRTGVLAISDIHYGKMFESINNTHSTERVNEKMNFLLNEVIHICEKEQLDELTIVNCGDSIDGLLRVSQLKLLEMGVVQQTIEYSRLMCEWLNTLSQYVRIKYHHVPSANHSELRPLGTRAGQFPQEDMESIIMHYVADVLKDNSRIIIPIEDKQNFIRLNIQGYEVFCYHGHQFSSKKPEVILKDLTTLHQIFIDFLILGHLHHTEIVSVATGNNFSKQVLYVPSIMGNDGFSDKICKGSYAGANFFVFERNRGKTITYEIALE